LVPCGFGIGVQADVVEDLKVSVEHEAGTFAVSQVLPIELPLCCCATLVSNILEKIISWVEGALSYQL